jgi:hypothetical protein
MRLKLKKVSERIFLARHWFQNFRKFPNMDKSMLSLFLLVFFIWTVKGNPNLNVRYIKTLHNVVNSFTNTTSTLQFFFKARSRFGYFYCAFSQNNTSFENGLVLLMVTNYTTGYDSYRNITYWRLQGQNNTEIEQTPSLYQPDPWMILDHYKTDLNYFPIGRYINDLSYNVFLNRTLYPWITEETWIHTGFSMYNNPLDPTVLASPDETEVIQVKDIATLDNLYFSPTARVEQMSMIPFIIELIALPCILILCIGLQMAKMQPIYSRGITPALACIGNFLHIFSGITQYIYTLEDFKYNCIWLFFCQWAVLLTLLFLSLFHFFRYLLIVNLNKEKSLALNKIQKTEDTKATQLESVWTGRKFQLLKLLGSSWFLLGLVVCTYLFYVLIFFIGFASTNFVCNSTIIWHTVFYVVSLSLFLIAFGILFIYDVILNFAKLKKCRIFSVLREDLYFYRFEIYILGLFLVFPFWLISLFMNPDFFQVKSFRFARNQLRPEIPVVSSLASVSFYTFFFMQCGFVLIMTLIKALIGLICRKPKKKGAMAEWIKNEDRKKLFIEFLEKEWSVENMQCYDQCHKFLKIIDPEEKLDCARKLYMTHLSGKKATLEVNVPNSITQEIRTKLYALQITDDLFDRLLGEIVMNLNDSFARFTVTIAYSQAQNRQDLIKN